MFKVKVEEIDESINYFGVNCEDDVLKNIDNNSYPLSYALAFLGIIDNVKIERKLYE
jgi:hypothetical protein